MGTLNDVRTGLKNNLLITFGSRYTIYDYEDKSPAPSAIIIGWPDSYDPRATLEGAVDILIPIRFEIPWDHDRTSDDELETMMDAAVAAIEYDRQLGGACSDLSCAPFTSIGARTMPNDQVVITFTVPVEVVV